MVLAGDILHCEAVGQRTDDRADVIDGVRRSYLASVDLEEDRVRLAVGAQSLSDTMVRASRNVGSVPTAARSAKAV